MEKNKYIAYMVEGIKYFASDVEDAVRQADDDEKEINLKLIIDILDNLTKNL